MELIIIPITVGIITQAIKLIIDGIPNNFNWQHLINDYGGMPSSHTAFVTSLATIIGMSQGIQTASFAISLVLTAVVVRDAIGFRREIGRNNLLTNKLAQHHLGRFTPLNEKMGHSTTEVAAGLLVGSSLSIFIYLLLIWFSL